MIPGLGRSPGEGNGNPLQYSCLDNPMDRGAWWAILHGVAKSRTRLRDFTMSHSLDSVSSVQFSSVAQSCLTLCDPMNRSTPGLPVHHQLRSPPKPMSIEPMMPSNHLILCPFLLLPSIFPSIRVFSNELALCIRWSKYWNFASTSVLPMNIQE